MPPDGQRIRAARSDMTDWLIHWTRSQSIDGKHHKPIEMLQIILQCGYLKPTFALRRSYTDYPIVGPEKPRIHGCHPAVCFTDQTLRAFIQSYTNLPTVPVQVVKTSLTLQIAPSERLREAETVQRHPAGPLRTPL
jgi:hypothetical protein